MEFIVRGSQVYRLSLSVCHLLFARRNWRKHVRFLWHYDPRYWVCKKTNKRHHSDNEPDYPDQRDIQVKVLRNTGADASNLSTRSWPHQAFSCRYRSDTLPAIGTNIRVVLDHLATVVTVHG
jgi:hypothetical protein